MILLDHRAGNNLLGEAPYTVEAQEGDALMVQHSLRTRQILLENPEKSVAIGDSDPRRVLALLLPS